MTKVSGKIYKYDVPKEMTGIIFNNGSGTKTENLTMPTVSGKIYNYSTDKWTTYSG